MKTC